MHFQDEETILKQQLRGQIKPYCVPFKGKNGVLCCEARPLSPKKILPDPSDSKHIEKEFLTKPAFAREFGSAIAPNPSPKSPSGAPLLRKFPDWTCPHLSKIEDQPTYAVH